MFSLRVVLHTISCLLRAQLNVSEARVAHHRTILEGGHNARSRPSTSYNARLLSADRKRQGGVPSPPRGLAMSCVEQNRKMILSKTVSRQISRLWVLTPRRDPCPVMASPSRLKGSASCILIDFSIQIRTSHRMDITYIHKSIYCIVYRYPLVYS